MSDVSWAILTGEYPPQSGGVADYTALVAHALAARGDRVRVYAPRCDGADQTPSGGVEVVRLPDHFGPRGLAALDGWLHRRPRPDRVLIQYVPHAFGYRAMNLAFAAWVSARAGRVAPVWVMFHEVNVPFRWWPAASALLGAAHALMARLVVGAAGRVFVSIPAWGDRLRRICPRVRTAEWLPIPSNIPAEHGPRVGHTGDGAVIGHFGTYGPATAGLLGAALNRLLAAGPGRAAVLLGRGGAAFRDGFAARFPALADRVLAPGELPPDALSARLRECDVLLQPYSDGISSRRTSAMAGLANGVAVVTNLGELSEPLWAGAEGIRLAAAPDPDALAAAVEAVLTLPAPAREELGRRAAVLYRDRFALENTLARLRGPA
jgi:glycosyltransferase involved in cell wall biosynthesis